MFDNFLKQLPAVLPRHIAVVMDGNGRWAEQRNLPRMAGHKAGVAAARLITELCGQTQRIQALTLFAFSSENWQRPAAEVDYLMQLFMVVIQRETKKLHKHQVKLKVIGDFSRLPPKLLAKIQQCEAMTAANTGLQLNIALNYGGRWDIIHACQQLAQQVESGELTAAAISEHQLAAHLCLTDIPEPDLFIRTGGEIRISNFLLWQLAYTELHFSKVLWPDFNQNHLLTALIDYANRQRRFGQTSAQRTPS